MLAVVALIALASGSSRPDSPPIDETVGVVGGQPVTLDEYQQWLLDLNGVTLLPQFLESRMLEMAARDRGCAASDAEVAAAFDTEWNTVVKLRFGGDEARFIAELTEGGHTRESYRKMRSLAIRSESNLDRLAARTRDTTDAALAARFASDYGTPPVALSVRVIQIGKFALEKESVRAGKARSASTTEMETNAEKLAQDVFRRVSAGDDFAQLARDFSTDLDSKANGGLVTHLTPERFGSAVHAAAVATSLDQPVAPLVRDNMGFTIVKLESRKTVALDDVREALIDAILEAPVSGTERGDTLAKLRAQYEIVVHPPK